MITNKFSIILLLLSIHLYVSKESDLEFLEHKTIDALRQIYWSSIELIPHKKIKIEYEKEDFFNDNREELISKIKNVADKFSIEYDLIKENKVFEINIADDISKLIRNETIPRKFLINFAFNIDKYIRIQNQEINGASDYLNYLPKHDIQLYIFEKKKLTQYTILSSPECFKKYILNDIDFNFCDIDKYIKSKSKKELIQLIYSFEKYCFSYDNEENSICQIPYKMYDHESLDSYTENDLNSILSTYKRKLNITDLSIFISKIENQGFTYINSKQLFQSCSLIELKNNVKAFETYYRRHKKQMPPLSKRDEYIERLNDIQLKDILEWAVDIFPELNEKLRFKDILSSETILQYGQVKYFLQTSERNKLLKYAINIHTYQNKIKSKFDHELINLIRLNDNKLVQLISKDTNNNINLQERTNFVYFANLHENDIREYFKHLQRNQLKDITKMIINLSFLKTKNQDGRILSQKKDILDSVEIMNDEDLLNTALNYAENLKIKNIFDIQYYQNEYEDYSIPIAFRYFYNIMDFFRSTDIKYLRVWLRKYELEIRKLRSERYLAGGLKNNFMNFGEYPKNELLKIFDIYVHEYPELFSPEKFIKFAGLDNGFTPHKFLLENGTDPSIKEKMILSLASYVEKKKININFDYKEYSTLIYVEDYDEYGEIKRYIQNNFLFSIFRIINIFPELNNLEIFKRICLNETTRVLSIFEFYNYFNTSRNLSKIAYNIDYYYFHTSNTDSDEEISFNFSKSDEEYKNSIEKFVYTPLEDEIKIQILDGDFYSIFYACELFFEDDSKAVIKNTYNLLDMKKYIKNYVDDRKLQIKAICKAIKKYEELQDVEFFDKEYYYINITSEGYESVEDIYNYLTRVDNRKIFYYCLLANFIKIDFEKKPDFREKMKDLKDIYLKIHYMSRNEMIRYILNLAKSDETIKGFFTEENLLKLIKKYFLDLGSDNANDLTMF